MNNEPAFPRDHRYDGHNGLTKEEYITIEFMKAFITGYSSRGEKAVPSAGWLAGEAKEFAHALIKALK